MNEFLISKNLDRELEAKRNEKQTKDCQKEEPLQAGGENQRQGNQQPFKAKSEAKIVRHVCDSRVIDRVAPVKELGMCGITIPVLKMKHRGKANNSEGKDKPNHMK